MRFDDFPIHCWEADSNLEAIDRPPAGTPLGMSETNQPVEPLVEPVVDNGSIQYDYRNYII